MTKARRPQIDWPTVAARLAPARTYWLATVARDGAPHVAPVWGVVVGPTWFAYSERGTVKATNLRADPRVVIHLDGGADVVIVHGSLVDVGRPDARPDVIAAFDAKYDEPADRAYLPSVDPSFDVLYELVPASALMWLLEDYDRSQRRWRAGN